MQINFSKYNGTANDFIIINNFNNSFKSDKSLVSAMCNRRTGIGADGLLLLNKSDKYDFEMQYFNSDGKKASFCGNGGRCIAAYAYNLGITGNIMIFKAFDGIHKAEIINVNKNIFDVKLSMKDVGLITEINDIFLTHTGSPHAIKKVNNLENIDVFGEGRKIRNSKIFDKEGVNVNFVKINKSSINIRTYERGVEDETFSCGTGVTASALYAALFHNKKSPVKVNTKGGELWVYFNINKDKTFTNVILEGPVVYVFDGTFNF